MPEWCGLTRIGESLPGRASLPIATILWWAAVSPDVNAPDQAIGIPRSNATVITAAGRDAEMSNERTV